MNNAQLNGCKYEGWQCFHCGEAFETVGGARDHFGFDQSGDPACRIKLGAERGLVMALREAEKENAKLLVRLNDESSDMARASAAAQGRHDAQFRLAEELGYERGLKDAVMCDWQVMLEATKEIIYRANPQIPITDNGWEYLKSCLMLKIMANKP